MKTYLIAFLTASVINLVLSFIFIPLLKKLKFKQTVLSYVEEHKEKNGTPTMAGLIFIPSAIITALIFSKGSNRLLIMSVAITLAYLVVGVIDDGLKIKLNRNLGLTATQKIIFQTAISLLAGIYAYRSGIDFVYIPFSLKIVYFRILSVFFTIFLFIATVNSVNLTDGLDGLCGSVSLIYFLGISVIIFLENKNNSNIYLNLNEYDNLIKFSVSIMGALFSYLLFNTNKAKIFMGDTGSLSLGGAISAVSVFSGNSLYVAVLGVCFIISSLTVIIQVLHYKRTKKRVFLIAPYHHNLQKKGLSESKIVYIYSFITLFLAVLSVIFII